MQFRSREITSRSARETGYQGRQTESRPERVNSYSRSQDPLTAEVGSLWDSKPRKPLTPGKMKKDGTSSGFLAVTLQLPSGPTEIKSLISPLQNKRGQHDVLSRLHWKCIPAPTTAMQQGETESAHPCRRSTVPTQCLSIPKGQRRAACAHLQVCDEAPCIVFFVLRGWVDPDEAVVAQDH